MIIIRSEKPISAPLPASEKQNIMVIQKLSDNLTINDKPVEPWEIISSEFPKVEGSLDFLIFEKPAQEQK
jgi:hypothetical protein